MGKIDETEDEYFINKRALGELFDSTYALNVNLWRGQKPDQRGAPPLYPILKAFKLSNGRTRNPDIATYTKGGELWVNCKSGGVSLFDLLGVPVKRWDYYCIPAGTKLPRGLVITKDTFNSNFGATHYSVRPNWDMPVSRFCMLLDDLSKLLVSEG